MRIILSLFLKMFCLLVNFVAQKCITFLFRPTARADQKFIELFIVRSRRGRFFFFINFKLR